MSDAAASYKFSISILTEAASVLFFCGFVKFSHNHRLKSLSAKYTTDLRNHFSKVQPFRLHGSAAAHRTPLAHTTIPHGAAVHGFTIFDDLYLRNGTLYVVTKDRSAFPPRDAVLSRPFDLGANEDFTPTDKELQFVQPEEAEQILGGHSVRVRDFTVLMYDPAQFMKHYYHWWGEIILGVWRVYSAMNLNTQPPPARFLLPFARFEEWRDRAGVDAPLMRAAFPYASIEQSEYWKDILALNLTIVFERVMVVNRETAHRHPFGSRWFKMIAGTMNLTVPDNFWAPVRESLVRNVLGYLPRLDESGAVLPSAGLPASKPIVTYINRQQTGRRLRRKDHQSLVRALNRLQAQGLCEVHIALMERMGLREQIELAARTTIMIGVHGNGLTHQLWMPPTPRSTVMEIFNPEGYIFDYEILARNMGHRHYAVWNDTLVTYPKGTYHEGVNFNFENADAIPVYGPAIAEVVRKRLTEPVS